MTNWSLRLFYSPYTPPCFPHGNNIFIVICSSRFGQSVSRLSKSVYVLTLTLKILKCREHQFITPLPFAVLRLFSLLPNQIYSIPAGTIMAKSISSILSLFILWHYILLRCMCVCVSVYLQCAFHWRAVSFRRITEIYGIIHTGDLCHIGFDMRCICKRTQS